MIAVVVGLGLMLVGGPGDLVEVESDTACPSAEAVAERLRRMLPPPGPGAKRDRAKIHTSDSAIRVALHDAQGALLGDRTLAADPRCDEAAGAVAVVIAAWQAERLPAGPTPTAPPASPAPSTSPAETPALKSPDATAPKAPEPPPPDILPDATRRRGYVEIGAGLVGSLAPNTSPLAGGGAVDVSIGPGASGPRVRLTLAALSFREAPLGATAALFTRPAAALEFVHRAPLGASGRASIDLHAGALLGLVVVSGERLAAGRTRFGFDPGFCIGPRLGLRAGPATVFIDASLWAWLNESVIYTDARDASAVLPRVEVLLLGGVAFGRPF